VEGEGGASACFDGGYIVQVRIAAHLVCLPDGCCGAGKIIVIHAVGTLILGVQRRKNAVSAVFFSRRTSLP
jgi:hypothetical protein